MPSPPDMAQRHSDILTELSALGLALARDLQGRALAATDDAAACDLSLAFHRISRSLRQTLALEARLERERGQALREAAQDEARQALARVQKKRGVLRGELTRLIWDEAEGEEAEDLLHNLEFRLMEESEDEEFLEAPIDACIARLRQGLGLSPAPAAGAAGAAAPQVVIWRSSA